MRAWQFSEQPYHPAWDADPTSLRITLPSHHFDPVVASDLLNRYLDEWSLCDELGIDIMVNEHHSTATSLSVSPMLTLGMLARTTKRARLLALGIPLANRSDPVRIAEEISYVDVVSRGRIEMGFVRGAPYEIAATNSNPVRMMERFWESLDLIVKAMTTVDGPFRWEGEYFHHRQVNIWPRPYQAPHPRVWISAASSVASAIPIAERGYNLGTVFSRPNARNLYHAYRVRTAELGREDPGPDRFAYTGLVGVGRTRAEGMDRLRQIKAYLETSPRVASQFVNPPGYSPANAVAKIMAAQSKERAGAEHLKVFTQDQRKVNIPTASAEDLVDAGIAFGGTPDDVYQQLKQFHEDVGGMGNLIMMAHGGSLSHKDTADNLTLFAREVAPRIAELKPIRSGRDFDTIEEIRASAKANAA